MTDRLINIQKLNISTKKKISNLSRNWDEIKNCDDPNEDYKQFFNIFNLIYDIYFPKVFVTLKTKHIQSPWIKKWIAKSS